MIFMFLELAKTLLFTFHYGSILIFGDFIYSVIISIYIPLWFYSNDI